MSPSLDWLRRALGPATVNVTITSDAVIRPGDTVLLCVPGDWQNRDLIRARAKGWLPDGANVVVFCAWGAEALNLTAFTEKLLNNLRDGGADRRSKDDRPEPLAPPEEAGNRPGDLSGAGDVVDGLARPVVGDQDSWRPDRVPEPAEHSHEADGSSRTAQLPHNGLPAHEPQGKNPAGHENDLSRVRRGGADG